MRIQYSISTFLSILVIVNACQDVTHQAYMNGNNTHAHGRAKEENGVASTLCEAIVSGHPGAITQNGHGHVSPATSSNDALASTEQSVYVLQPHSTISDKNATAEVVQGQGEKKEEGSEASSGLIDWFQRFVDVLDHAEEWAEVVGVLAEGRRHGYLDKGVVWGDDQYTPLHYAAEVGDLDVVQELTEKYKISVDITVGIYESTPLHLSALEGHLEVVKYLISKGADWGAVDSKQSNSLHYASLGIKGHHNTEIVKFLIEGQYADYKSLANNEFSLLYLAIKAANVDLVRYIANQFPDLLSMTTCSVSPLAFAQYRHEAEIVAIIQQKLQEKEQDPCQQLTERCNLS